MLFYQADERRMTSSYDLIQTLDEASIDASHLIGAERVYISTAV